MVSKATANPKYNSVLRKKLKAEAEAKLNDPSLTNDERMKLRLAGKRTWMLETLEKPWEDNAAKRARAKERRVTKPHGDVIQRAKIIWEELRQTNLDKEKRKELLNDLMGVMQGRIHELVFKHDASRVIQTAIKHSSEDQVQQIAQELQGTFVELSKSTYGKFLVSKLLHYGSKRTRQFVVSEFEGHVRELVRHREASYVIEDIFREYGNAHHRASILHEFYGSTYAVFKDANDVRTLEDILTAEPDRRPMILDSMMEILKPVLEKQMFSWTLVHKVILDILRHGRKQDFDEINDLVGEHISEIVHTKDGSDAAILMLARGSSKERKQMVKGLKSYVLKIAQDEFGFLVLIAATEIVDDVLLMDKQVLQPLLASDFNADIAQNPNARLVISHLLKGQYLKFAGSPHREVIRREWRALRIETR